MKWLAHILWTSLAGILLSIPSHGATQEIDFSSPSSGCVSFGNISFDTGKVIFQTGGGIYQTLFSCDIPLLQEGTLEFQYLFENTGPDEISNTDFPSYFQDSFQMEINARYENYGPYLLADQDTRVFENFGWSPDSITPGGSVTVTFSLLDEDDGRQSRAVLKDLVLINHTVPEPETLLLLGGGMIVLFLTGRMSARRGIQRWVWVPAFTLGLIVHFSEDVLGETPEQNVDFQVSFSFASPLLDSLTSTLTGSMTVKNTSDRTLYGPLWVVIVGISDPSVVLINASGVTRDGKPYLDLSGLLPNGMLRPGESTPPVKMAFYNPKKLRFRWDQDILVSGDDSSPEDSRISGPIIDNVCVRPGEAPAVCAFDLEDFETANPAFDALEKKVLPEMYAQSRILVFTYDDVYDVEDLQVLVEGEAARMDEQGAFYADLLLAEGRNEVFIESRSPSGASVTRTLVLTVDTHLPEISIMTPKPDQVAADAATIVEGKVDDPEVDRVTIISQAGTIQVPVVQMRFSAAMELRLGPNPIRVEAVDQAGNRSSREVQVLRVRTAMGSLQGLILSGPVGVPISGAIVRAYPFGTDQQDPFTSTISESEGRYVLTDIPSGMLLIHVIHEGYQPEESNFLFLGGEDPENRNFALIPSQAANTVLLTGVVKDRSGRPLPDVLISITGLSHTATTGEDGLYLIPDVPKTSFWISVEKAGFYPASVPMTSLNPEPAVITQSFILDKAPEPIVIHRPAPGGILRTRSTVVLGEIRPDLVTPENEIDVRVNGFPAVLYENHFVVNHLPLTSGTNLITVEVRTPSGFSVSATAKVEADPMDIESRLRAEWEEGTAPFPLLLSMDPVFPEGTYRASVEGPAPLEFWGERGKYEGLIAAPGIYIFTVVQEQGEAVFEDEVAVVVSGKEDLEFRLWKKWDAIVHPLSNGDVESALAHFTPEAAFRYREFMSDIPDLVGPFFVNLEEIELIEMRGGVAQVRLERDGLTYYLWFIRDVDGSYKLHRF